METSTFWSLISRLDWQAEDDHDAVRRPLLAALAALDNGAIQSFHNRLAERLHALDTKEHARHIGEGAWAGRQKPFSGDGFLYARAYVVAQGRSAYEAVLQDPALWPKDRQFEPLLYVAQEAHRLKNGCACTVLHATSYETYANADGWGDLAGSWSPLWRPCPS